MNDTPRDAPPSIDEQARLQRRSFVRAVSRDALQAAAALVGVSEAVRSAALRAVTVNRPMTSFELELAPVPTVAARPADALRGISAYRRDDEGRLLVTDRTLLPDTVREVACANGSDLARLLGRHAIGSGPVLGELSAWALAGTAAAVVSLDGPGRVNVLRATSAIIASTRPSSAALAKALRSCATILETDVEGPVPERLAALGDSLAADLAAAVEAMAGHAAALASSSLSNGGDLLLHGGFARLATGSRSAAAELVRQTRALGADPGVWLAEGRPSGEGRIATARDLAAEGIRSTVVADAVIGTLVASGRIGAVLVSAERVMVDGTVIGPVGTYALAVMAALHRIPFLVLAPTAVRDGPAASSRDHVTTQVPRQGAERPGALLVQATDAPPLMDQTPPELVTAIITEVGST